MWLDAFIPKNRNMLNIGVLGVPGVPLPSKPNEYVGLAGTPSRNTAKSQGVPGVPLQQAGTPGTPRNTAEKTCCSSVPPPHKPNEYVGLAICGTPGTPGTPQKHLSAENAETLAQFCFDLVEQEIEAGYPVEELRRVNNIAWRLITARGFQFQEAITAAAQWVVDNPPHRDEAAFVDVMELFKRSQH